MSPELGGGARTGSGRVLARVGPTLILWVDWKGDRDSPEAYNIPAMEPRIQYAKTSDGVSGGCEPTEGLLGQKRRNLPPAGIFLSLQPAQVSGRDSQVGVVEEVADLFHSLAYIPPELRRAVPEHVDTAGG